MTVPVAVSVKEMKTTLSGASVHNILDDLLIEIAKSTSEKPAIVEVSADVFRYYLRALSWDKRKFGIDHDFKYDYVLEYLNMPMVLVVPFDRLARFKSSTGTVLGILEE
jgi:hypothetical protein